MNVETRERVFVSPPQKKVRIGSRVPEENREWLKRHGIVTDKAFPQKLPSFSILTLKQYFKKAAVIAAVLFMGLLLAVLFQQQQYLSDQIRLEQVRWQSLSAGNRHLREKLEQLSTVNSVQQAEIHRMAGQFQGLKQGYTYQIQGLEKGEAMSSALHHVFENALGKMSSRYDREVGALRKQVSKKDEMISSLQTSLQSMDGLVVQADPIANSGGMTNGAISAVNQDFQFVIVNIGELKGAQPGQMVELYHRGKLIGYGEVEKTYPEYSGVKVFSLAVISELQEGDAAFLKSSAAAD